MDVKNTIRFLLEVTDWQTDGGVSVKRDALDILMLSGRDDGCSWPIANALDLGLEITKLDGCRIKKIYLINNTGWVQYEQSRLQDYFVLVKNGSVDLRDLMRLYYSVASTRGGHTETDFLMEMANFDEGGDYGEDILSNFESTINSCYESCVDDDGSFLEGETKAFLINFFDYEDALLGNTMPTPDWYRNYDPIYVIQNDTGVTFADLARGLYSVKSSKFDNLYESLSEALFTPRQDGFELNLRFSSDPLELN